ncbi:pyridoxamine 5'-phosphate oxidase [Sporothrix schenckii 1099-18]|uniref:pyridoxal 5'-phosphate synthase n=2 Tax=Sporothrix schenckii TaxID=29908 RepID=U7Q2N4_SPOS1|nr:pyridoxamine 5'-phosphate oxidase [Sporothrix schenckii 1099-18]ERT01412.1 pyridoxamine 5'-phosphate oxidase [Sporothrix schenckii ATCC 58251]KJR88601.1 pyridoxamine 5'-phosphate oxidase [Sporothrix schenckii 1099-18]
MSDPSSTAAAAAAVSDDSSYVDDNDQIRSLLRNLPSLKGPYAPVDWAAFPTTPQAAFVRWLRDAIAEGGKTAAASATPYEPHAMTVSTVDAEGLPDARVLILKNVDGRGWHFAVKAASPKGRQLMANSACCLTFYWSSLGRQVRIRGRALPLPVEECAADFLARPLASRVSAVASPQSEVMVDPATSENELSKRTAEAQALFDKDPEYVSPGWLVYAVAPTDVEFWQGATDRQHHRLRQGGKPPKPKMEV